MGAAERHRKSSKGLSNRKIKQDLPDRIIQAVIYVILIALCLTIVLPCLNILALSFNDGKDAAQGGVYFIPRVFTLENYKEVFRDGKIMRAYGITVARTVIGTFLSLAVTSFAAFALREPRLPFRKIITFLITFTMLFSGGLIPTYIQYNNLGLLNNFWIYIVPSLVTVTYLMMMRAFFESLPGSLDESAMLDGCGYFRIFFSITLPLSKAVIAVVGLYTAVNHWNDWFSGSFYMNSDKLWPVQTVLQQMLARAMAAKNDTTNLASVIVRANRTVTSDSLKMSAVVITTVPILCVYPFVQKYFAQGAMMGAVKG